MRIKTLLEKSVELSIIDERQSSEMLALNNNDSRPWIEWLYDVALLIMPLSAQGILWHLSNGGKITGPITALTFLVAAIVANKLLNGRFASIYLVIASSCGLLVLSGAMSLSASFVSGADIELALFTTGALAALWSFKLGLNKHVLIRFSFITSLLVSIASWIDTANSINLITSYLMVSTIVLFCSLLPFSNSLTLCSQVVGASFFIFSLLIFTLTEIDSYLISTSLWGGLIAMGLALKSKHPTCIDILPKAFIVAGTLCMIGTIMSAVVDRIGFGVPVASILLLMSFLIVALVRK